MHLADILIYSATAMVWLSAGFEAPPVSLSEPNSQLSS